MSDKNYRSAKTGQFVTQDYAKKHPSTTMGEKRDGQPTGRERSAKTGQFVKDGTASRRPATTVKEK